MEASWNELQEVVNLRKAESVLEQRPREGPCGNVNSSSGSRPDQMIDCYFLYSAWESQ